MSNPLPKGSVRPLALPPAPSCADCGASLTEPYGWCAGCRKAYCFPCGRRHYCTPQCPANGCFAGLCVRVVEGRRLSERWGLPEE
ncbi:MAG: hypothetical protein M3Q10_19635 [Chloroflexota bacterium]|nr:hypothetical protein [Chloroflexota bacterium]